MKEVIVDAEDLVCLNKEKLQELIRCKDCKHKNEYGYCTLYLNFHHLTADMDYCSYAERKEDETD